MAGTSAPSTKQLNMSLNLCSFESNIGGEDEGPSRVCDHDGGCWKERPWTISFRLRGHWFVLSVNQWLFWQKCKQNEISFNSFWLRLYPEVTFSNSRFVSDFSPFSLLSSVGRRLRGCISTRSSRKWRRRLPCLRLLHQRRRRPRPQTVPPPLRRQPSNTAH